MKITIIEPQFIDYAWAEGADCLSEVCDMVDEITGDQLKLLLSRGERHLAKLEFEGQVVGWAAFRVDQLPNLRALVITDLVCRNYFEQFMDETRRYAKAFGCSRIRCSAHDAQARLYRMKFGFQPVYTTMEVKV